MQSTELKAVVEAHKDKNVPEELGGVIFMMHANRKINAGEEVLHSYGTYSDVELLESYGFVESFAVKEKSLHPLAGWCPALGGT